MKVETWRRVRRLFEEWLEVDEGSRGEFVREHCADPEVRGEIDRLLDAHSRWSGRLEPPRIEELAAPTPEEGAELGEFRLLRLLGSGGMGAVWEAEQRAPRRRVAVKLLRLGFGGAESRRRFEEEASILARLRHPAVAQVYGAGVVEFGGVEQPWFALELVEGARHLAEYAREEELDLRGKIELLACVCDGVQHGHERGVLHRDLKPENVLVGPDGRPKVIDFGVARTLDGDGGASSFATRAGELVGTLRTMSPEQLAADPAEVDTRSDVYSLGATAFEVLCGAPPHDVGGLSITRAIRRMEEEPPRRPRSLCADLPRDIENVLLRALARDRAERYPSAAALAEDMRRFLRHEPVSATPPRLGHQLRLLARRHRAATAVAVVSVALLLLALAGALALWLRAEREVEKSRDVNEFFAWILGSAAPDVLGPDATVVEALEIAAPLIEEDFAAWPDVRQSLHATVGRTLDALGRSGTARPHLLRSVALAEEVYGPRSAEALGAHVDLGVHLSWFPEELARSIELLEEVDAEATRALGGDSVVALRAAHALAWAREEAGETGDIAAQLRATLARWEAVHDPADPFAATLRNDLALVLHRAGELAEAESLYRAAIAAFEARSHPSAMDVRLNLGPLLFEQGRTEEGRDLLAETHALVVETLGPAHGLAARAALALAQAELGFGEAERARELLDGMREARAAAGVADGSFDDQASEMLGSIAYNQGRAAEAAAHFGDAARWREANLGPQHGLTLRVRHNEAMSLLAAGEFEAGTRRLEDLLATKRAALGESDPSTLVTLHGVGEALQGAGEHARALERYREAEGAYASALGPDDPRTLTSAMCVGSALVELGEHEQAERQLRAVLAALPETRGGPAALARVGAHEALARALHATERHDEARMELEAAGNLAREVLPAGHPTRVRVEKLEADWAQ